MITISVTALIAIIAKSIIFLMMTGIIAVCCFYTDDPRRGIKGPFIAFAIGESILIAVFYLSNVVKFVA